MGLGVPSEGTREARAESSVLEIEEVGVAKKIRL